MKEDEQWHAIARRYIILRFSRMSRIIIFSDLIVT